MHVSAAQLRVVTRGPMQLRFAPLGHGVAFALVELPDEGSLGTSLEEACTEAHWGVVLRGSLDVVRGPWHRTMAAGTAFHIPSGPPAHWMLAEERTSLAGFIPLDKDPKGRFRDLGAPPDAAPAGIAASLGDDSLPLVIRDDGDVEVPPGRVEAHGAEMGPWLFCRARFGRTSGYATSWCDAEHYGIVAEGDLAIEWESDVELLAAGDIYYCPAGPPGHRFEVADAATVVDFTPISGIGSGRRLADWRVGIAGARARS